VDKLFIKNLKNKNKKEGGGERRAKPATPNECGREGGEKF
jgi:hypothetical protein